MKVLNQTKIVGLVIGLTIGLAACAQKYVSDEEVAYRRNVLIDESRQSVIVALAGGTGPITLHGVSGKKTALTDVRFLPEGNPVPEGICGTAVKVLAVYADWSTRTGNYPPPRNEVERREFQRCVRFESFHRATPGVF